MEQDAGTWGPLGIRILFKERAYIQKGEANGR